jgi:putative hydrolase of the HAD superfamily
MPIRIPDHVIVFDYGEVISVTPTEADRAALVSLAGVEPGLFWPEYWRHRDALDEGTLSISDYWRGIAAATDANWSDAMIHRLWVTDFRSWLSADPGTLEVLVELRDGDTRMALLSNAGADFSSYFRHGPLGALFEAVFVSGELGMIKPAAPIFEHVMRELGITAAQTVFIDNKEVNVRAAEALGITGHVFTDAGRLRDFLVALSTHRQEPRA